MNTLRRWLPIALCCLPGVAAAAVIGIGAAVGGAAAGAFLNGPLGLGLIVLAVLACPLSMGWMMWRAANRKAASSSAVMMADCCAPGEVPTPAEAGPSAERLAALRAQREAFERELATPQAEADAA